MLLRMQTKGNASKVLMGKSSFYRKQYEDSSREIKIHLPYDRSIPLFSIHLNNFKSTHHSDTCASVSIAELSVIAKLWNQAKCLATEDGQRNIYINIMINFQLKQRMNLCHFRKMHVHNNNFSQFQKDKYSNFYSIVGPMPYRYIGSYIYLQCEGTSETGKQNRLTGVQDRGGGKIVKYKGNVLNTYFIIV